jgi:DNA-binding beta-propeller fold protein YncE
MTGARSHRWVRLLARGAAGAALLTTLAIGTPSLASGPPTYFRDFAGPGLADMYPVDVAVCGSSYFVLDAGRYRIVEIDRTTGLIVDQVGGHQGKSTVRFGAARAIATDAACNVYLADTSNNRIVKFTSDLAPLPGWGNKGSGQGQFNQDYGIAVGPGKDANGDPAEVVYVTDGYTGGAAGRVQKFALNGTWLDQFGTSELNKPRQLTVDPATKYVWVVRASDKRLLVYNASSNLVATYGNGIGTGAGQFKEDPRGIAITASGQVFITDPGNHRVQVWTTSGTTNCSFGTVGTNGNQFLEIRGLVDTDNGNLLITDEWDYSLKQLTFSAAACPAITYGAELFGSPPPVGGVNSPRGLDTDASGRLIASDWWNQRWERWNADGTSPFAVGHRGNRPELGALNFAWDVAVQPGTGRIFMANRESYEIEVFEANGTPLGGFGKQGSGTGAQFKFPQGVAFTPDGSTLYVSDSGNNRIQVCDINPVNVVNTQCLSHYGLAGSGPGQFKVPTGLAVQSDGTLWVADTQNNRIQRRDADDGSWTTFSVPAGGTKFKLPWGVSVGPDGNIWVADSGNNRVVAMTPGGNQVFAFNGIGPGSSVPFDRPFDVAFSGSSVFVSDLWNNRIVELR